MVKNSSSLPRTGSLPDRTLMPLPAHSTSADHPVVPGNAQFRYPRSPLDSARGTGAGSACPGDCAPRGNGPLCLVTILSGCEINNFVGQPAQSVCYNLVAMFDLFRLW